MSWKIGSLDKVKVAVEEIPKNRDQFVKDTLNELADELLKEIKKNAPRDTGEYAGSWMKESVKDNKIQVTTNEGDLFTILEFTGRDPGRIEPFGDVLAFNWRGEDVFFKFVMHPGFDEMPHVRPGMRKTIKMGNQIIIKNLKKNMRIFK